MSKKVFLSVLLLLMMLFQTVVSVSAAVKEYYYDNAWHAYNGNEFKLSVNGKILQTSMPPIVFEGYSVVPAREVFESLGAVVDWDGQNRIVKVSYGGKKVLLTIDSTSASVNGRTVTMPIAAKIINDKTMIPVRFVGEQLGWQVNFDSKTDTVEIQNTVKQNAITSVKWETNQADTAGFLTVMTDAQKAEYSAFSMQNPSRIVLDVANVRNQSGKSTISVQDRNVEQIRLGQHEETTRLVIDLTEDTEYTVESDGASIVITVALHDRPTATPSPAATKSPTPTSSPTATGNPSKPTQTPAVQSSTPSAKPLVLQRYVTIDAGHGGVDPGAVYKDENGEQVFLEDGTPAAEEKEINLAVALKVQKKLEAAGVKVHMIRTTDTYVDFQKVGSIANEKQTSLFVSIHTNSAEVTEAGGIETWGYLGEGTNYNGMTSEKLSQNILEELIAATGANDRGVKDGKNLAVIRTTQMPATLVELGFITNPEEREKMMTDSYREILAEAITKGILKSLEEMGL